MGRTLVQGVCNECLMGVDPPRMHRMRCTLVYRGCNESVIGVDPSRIHRMGSTLG